MYHAGNPFGQAVSQEMLCLSPESGNESPGPCGLACRSSLSWFDRAPVPTPGVTRVFFFFKSTHRARPPRGIAAVLLPRKILVFFGRGTAPAPHLAYPEVCAGTKKGLPLPVGCHCKGISVTGHGSTSAIFDVEKRAREYNSGRAEERVRTIQDVERGPHVFRVCRNALCLEREGAFRHL